MLKIIFFNGKAFDTLWRLCKVFPTPTVPSNPNYLTLLTYGFWNSGRGHLAFKVMFLLVFSFPLAAYLLMKE